MTDVQAERAAIVTQIKGRAGQFREEARNATAQGLLKMAQKLNDHADVLVAMATDIAKRGRQ